MKIGADNQKKTIIAALLFILGLGLFIRMLSSPSEPSAAAKPSAPPAQTGRVQQSRRPPVRHAPGGTAKGVTDGPVTPNMDPRLRLATIAETENLAYTGNGRNIFKAQIEEPIPPPVAPAEVAKPMGPEPPPPPAPPPPIPLKFFGFASGSGNKTVFLSQNDDVFLAKEGDIVQRRYKIVKINSANVEVLDVLNNNRQTIPLTAG
jgi:hypothetical protein